jgi:hypothetical protein
MVAFPSARILESLCYMYHGAGDRLSDVHIA